MQNCLESVNEWYRRNRLSLNVPKSSVMAICSNRLDASDLIAPTVDDEALKIVDSTDYLGVIIDKHLSWCEQINHLSKLVSSKLFVLRGLRKVLPKALLEKIYLSCIQSHLDYACTVWGNCGQTLRKKIQRLQNQAARIICNNFDYINYDGIDLVKSLGWLTFEKRFNYLTAVMMFKAIHGLAPNYISDEIHLSRDIAECSTRSANSMAAHCPRYNKEFLHKAFYVSGPEIWNSLPSTVQNLSSLNSFKVECRKYFHES